MARKKNYRESNQPYWTQTSWERGSHESREDYEDRIRDLNDYNEYYDS